MKSLEEIRVDNDRAVARAGKPQADAAALAAECEVLRQNAETAAHALGEARAECDRWRKRAQGAEADAAVARSLCGALGLAVAYAKQRGWLAAEGREAGR